MGCVIGPGRVDEKLNNDLRKLGLKVLKYDNESIDCSGKFSGSVWADLKKMGFHSFDVFLSFDGIANDCFICIRLLW